MHFLLIPENDFFHEIKCNGITSFMEFRNRSLPTKTRSLQRICGFVWETVIFAQNIKNPLQGFNKIFWKDSMYQRGTCHMIYEKNTSDFTSVYIPIKSLLAHWWTEHLKELSVIYLGWLEISITQVCLVFIWSSVNDPPVCGCVYTLDERSKSRQKET